MRSDRQHTCGVVTLTPREHSWVEATLGDRFAVQAERHHDCLAVIDGARRVTYGELRSHANTVARRLVDEGVDPGDRVALLADPGAGAAAAILGVLEAGAAFVPLDVLDPPARSAAVLETAGTRIVLTEPERATEAAAVVAHSRGAITLVDVGAIETSAPSGLSGRVTADSPASVFFTSGSTGAPKGVVDLHRNVLHNVLRYTNLLQISSADRLSLVQRTSFSGMASSLFSALLNGATVCTFPLTADRLPGLADWIEREGVTIFHSTPAIFRALVADGRLFSSVRVVRLEGDRASWKDLELFRRHFPPGSVLANGLGTTETGLACQYRLSHDTAPEAGILPVGFPAPGMEILIVDGEGVPLPDGELGEIAVRSRYLAQGYLGQPELTSERFLADPARGLRVYRTGDVGRIGACGRVDYVGRRDGTAKVGGIRVEPAEVEAALMRLGGVRAATVAVESGGDGRGRIVATVEPDDAALEQGDLRRGLAGLLPAFMIPSRIQIVAHLPVDSNWKLDRKPERAGEPSTRMERDLVAIFEDVLGTDVGVDDTFVSLGGDSLTAAEIAAAVELKLGLDLPPALLAEAPTVARLATALALAVPADVVRLSLLSDGGAGTPLVLVPDHRGQALSYARIARSISSGHPVWAVHLSSRRGVDLSVSAVAASIGASVRETFPDGPVVIGGFCYGALVAGEAARALRAEGRDASLVLLGLLPSDLPSLVAADALARWREAAGHRFSLKRIRFHLGRARTRPRRDALAYVAERVRTVAQILADRARGRSGSGSLQFAAQPFRPTPHAGSVTLVLGADTVSAYTDDPAAAWAALAEHVEVHVLPGDNAAALREPEQSGLVTVLCALLRDADLRQTVPYSASTMRTNSFVSS